MTEGINVSGSNFVPPERKNIDGSKPTNLEAVNIGQELSMPLSDNTRGLSIEKGPSTSAQPVKELTEEQELDAIRIFNQVLLLKGPEEGVHRFGNNKIQIKNIDEKTQEISFVDQDLKYEIGLRPDEKGIHTNEKLFSNNKLVNERTTYTDGKKKVSEEKRYNSYGKLIKDIYVERDKDGKPTLHIDKITGEKTRLTFPGYLLNGIIN